MAGQPIGVGPSGAPEVRGGGEPDSSDGAAGAGGELTPRGRLGRGSGIRSILVGGRGSWPAVRVEGWICRMEVGLHRSPTRLGRQLLDMIAQMG
jgi:hypothetical protein